MLATLLWSLQSIPLDGSLESVLSLPPPPPPRDTILTVNEVLTRVASHAAAGPLPCPLEEEEEEGCDRGACLDALPDDLLTHVLARLDPASLARSKAVSRRFRHLGMYFAFVNMRLQLYPHQQRGCAWMQQQESSQAESPNPFWKELAAVDPDGGGGRKPIFVNVVDGGIRLAPPERIRWTLGGILADEPGLGKTVTVQALIFKTMGRLPEIRADVVIEYGANGNKELRWVPEHPAGSLGGEGSAAYSTRSSSSSPLPQVPVPRVAAQLVRVGGGQCAQEALPVGPKDSADDQGRRCTRCRLGGAARGTR